MRILIVEDNLDLMENMVIYLNSYDYVVSTAGNGLEALEMLENECFDIVISDIKMPKYDGMELLRTIKEKHIKTEVIMVTAFSEEYGYMEVINAGAIDFLSKPFTNDELQAKVCRVVREIKLQKKLQQDLIEQKIYEEEKQKMQAIIYQQEKMASIGQLAAGVAHEINNPIGFITSNLASLQKYIEKLLNYVESVSDGLGSKELQQLYKKLKIDYISEDIYDLIGESIEGTTRLSEIVQNLKSFSRLDDEKLVDADINECLEDTIKVIWNELKYKVKLNKKYGELSLAKCNPRQLNQVFMNLLINASHAIDEQGIITIKTFEDEKELVVVISDTGNGISQENLNRLFEPFFTTKEVGKGTGLGLSIAHEIIQKHNGTISVESELGKGTAFTIKLPILSKVVEKV